MLNWIKVVYIGAVVCSQICFDIPSLKSLR